MSHNIFGVTALQIHTLNLFYSVSKFYQKSSGTWKELIFIQKPLFKLILKWYLNFQKFQQFEISESFHQIIILLFLFPQALDSFKSNWCQNHKRALVLNRWEIINIEKKKLQINAISSPLSYLHVLVQ